MPHDFFVTLNDQFAAEWEPVLGTRRLPVQSPIRRHVMLEGVGTTYAYMLALDQLSERQINAMAAHLSKKTGVDPATIRTEILRDGFPIREEATSSSTMQNPQRWV